MKTYTTAEAAGTLGKRPVTVRYLAKAHGIGTKHGRDWLFTDADIEALAAIPGPGRPAAKPNPEEDPGPAIGPHSPAGGRGGRRD